MTRKRRTTREEIEKIKELSKDYTIREISEMTGLSDFIVLSVQKRENVPNPKRKNRSLKKQEPLGEFFDIDHYARNYIY